MGGEEFVAPRGIEIVALGGPRGGAPAGRVAHRARGVRRHAVAGECLYSNSTSGYATRRHRPKGSFVALEQGEVVGYAGLLERANGSAVAEHGLTVVRRDRRRSGIASALKRAQLEWAARSGLVQLS